MAKHFMLHIDTSNAAFEAADGTWELARILAVLSDQVRRSDSLNKLAGLKLRDANGNVVGEVKVVEIGP